MSKNFEQEYKEHIASEVPDLWADIEARLPEEKNTKVVWWRSGKVLGSVAALVVLLGSAGIYLELGSLTRMESPAMDMAADCAEDEAVVEGMTSGEDAAGDSPAEEVYPAEDALMQDKTESNSVTTDSLTEEMIREDAASSENILEFNGMVSGEDRTENENLWNVWDAEVIVPDAEHDNDVEASVMTRLEYEVFGLINADWEKEGKRCYHVTLQEDVPALSLMAGDEMDLYVSEEFTELLEAGETYRLKVTNRESDEAWTESTITEYKIVGFY